MNNDIIQLKIKERLNKLASSDYDNLDCWQIVEAFNKGQVSWCRRQLHGLNIKKQGDEQSKAKIDDLQLLLTDDILTMTKKDRHVESSVFPKNYFEWKRLSGTAKNDCCPNTHNMVIYLAEEANVDELLRDNLKKPSFDWGETFCTLKGNKVHVYTNDEFELDKAILTYYRQPRYIQIKDCVDPYTQKVSTSNVECEFKDDIIELFIDEAVKILAGDLESINQQQTAASQVEGNN